MIPDLQNPSRDTLLMLLVFFIGAVFNYVYNIAMGWMLSPAQYGILGVAISFFLILSLFINAAFPLTVAKFLSEGGDDSIKHRVFKSSLTGNLFIALIVSFFFYASYASGLLRLDSTYLPFILLIVLALIFSSAGGVYASALQGMFRFKKYGLINIITTFAKLFSAVLLVMFGLGAVGAFFGMVAGPIAGLLLGVLLTSDFKFWKAKGWASRSMYTFALPMFFGMFFMTLLTNLDILGVKFLSESASSDTLTGYYRSAHILAELPVFVVGALMGAMFPYISRYSSSNYSNKTLKYTVLMICPLSIILFVIPSSMVALVFPDSYAAAADALGVLALGLGLFVIITALSGIFQAMRHPRVPAIVLTFSTLIEVIALIFLVPGYGILGAAVSTTIACAAGVLGLGGVYLKNGFFRFDYINTIKTLLGFVLLGVFAYIFPHNTRFLTVLDLLLSAGLYVSFLFIFGLLNKDDVSMILSGFNLDKRKLWRKT